MQHPSFLTRSDVTILGAGVIGLMTALELADAGWQVQIIDRHRAAMESSWAGGGIVSPLYPWRYAPGVTALATWSQMTYSGLIERLASQTGIDAQWLQTGMLVTAMAERDQALTWGQGLNPRVVPLSLDEAYALEPHVTLNEAPLWMPEIASVRTPRLGQALRKACVSHPGIHLLEHQHVILQGEVDAPHVLVEGRVIETPRLVVAAGAWSGQLLQSIGVDCPIRPMKGQMLLFAPSHRVSRVVLCDGRYAIPRADGRIVFGSTLEDVGFQRTPDRPAFDALYADALRLIPSLADVSVEAQWAGFRPGSPDGMPWIGPLSDSLWVNAGHFRNGVVLAPASARLLADMMLGRTPTIDPTPYQPRKAT